MKKFTEINEDSSYKGKKVEFEFNGNKYKGTITSTASDKYEITADSDKIPNKDGSAYIKIFGRNKDQFKVLEAVEIPKDMNIAVPSVAIMAPEDLEQIEQGVEPQIGEVTQSQPAKFFSKLFESREMAHIYHLQVKGDVGSHAAHTALNDYYDGVLSLIDTLIETYQGQYNLIENYDSIDTSGTNSKDKIEYFIELSSFIKDTRYSALLEEDTHLQNIVDEIVALIYRTLYKLKYTK